MADRSATAVIFINEHRRVVFANRSADEMEARRDGIRLGAAGISLLNRRDNETLQRLIAQALSPAAAAGAPGGAMRASRPSGRTPYGILIGPVSKQCPAMLATLQPAACIVITDPERKPSPPLDRLRNLFGLTEAEARLAALLAAGEDLRSASEQLQITYGTARSRLAEIFQKTDTRRQGELIALILATAAI